MLGVTLRMRVQTSMEPCTLPEIRVTSEMVSQLSFNFLFLLSTRFKKLLTCADSKIVYGFPSHRPRIDKILALAVSIRMSNSYGGGALMYNILITWEKGTFKNEMRDVDVAVNQHIYFTHVKFTTIRIVLIWFCFVIYIYIYIYINSVYKFPFYLCNISDKIFHIIMKRQLVGTLLYHV